jgi:glycosyltransferase involved in cell wall biosynthesis
MTYSKPILADTSLCAIIRDELMNPAGGVERFIRSIVPYVEQAVILDTGSVDGTREKLEELQAEFKNLKVYDRKFDNYVNSRNDSLRRVKTKWALVLDADELITTEGFEIIKRKMENLNLEIFQGFNFELAKIYPDMPIHISTNLHNPRLFTRNSYIKYGVPSSNITSEYLLDSRNGPPELVYRSHKCIGLGSTVFIYHFLPTSSSLNKKGHVWYGPSVKEKKILWQTPPSQMEGFQLWKVYNPKRDLYA